MRATAKVVGTPGLLRKFQALSDAARSEKLDAAAAAGGLLIANRWKELAPWRTGTYRRSIHVGGHTELTPDFKGEDLGVPGQGAARVTLLVGTAIKDPPYPWFLELGTSRMAPRPSAQPAFDETRDAAVAEMVRVLRKLLRKAAT